MRMLYLCQRIPYPPDKGDRIPVFHQIRMLSGSHEVVVGSLAHKDERNADELTKKLGIKVIAPRHSILRRAQGMVSSFLRNKPLSLGYFESRNLQSLVDSEITKKQFDAVIVFSSSMAQYLEKHKHIPRIMHFCDVDSEKWRDLAQKSKTPLCWIYKRESRTLLQYERNLANESRISCVVSHSEADVFRKRIPGIPVKVLENGVDVEYFSSFRRKPQGLRVVFIGVMDYPPNIDAVSFFAELVWSKIRAAYPQARFLIIGSKPVRSIRRMAKIPGIQITGYVPDVRPYLASATLTIAPLAIARGVQNKVLESMAAAVPVLTTPVVVRGLPAGAERHIFVAEREPEVFGSALMNLLENRAALDEKGIKAQEFVQQHCSWETKLRALEDLLEAVTLQHG
jgi:sugar transferase (PEP-CTERM/EpsH1 system associated)